MLRELQHKLTEFIDVTNDKEIVVVGGGGETIKNQGVGGNNVSNLMIIKLKCNITVQSS